MYAFLLAAGDYKWFSIAKLLLRHQVFSSAVVGLNSWEIFFLFAGGCALDIERKDLGTIDDGWTDMSGWLY